MCVCACVSCECLCAGVCVRARLFARVCVRVYVCESACECVYLRVRACVCMCVCVRECHVSVYMHVYGCVSACVRACECLCLSLQSTICWQESDKHHDLSLTMSGACSCLFGSGTSELYIMMFQTSPYMGILHEYIYVRMLGCMSTPLYVHVTHTQHTHTRTHNTHLFRSLRLHFGCMRTPGGTTCQYLHPTGPRSRVCSS